MLDKTDLKIIGCLEADSRQPVRDIAKKTGLRPSTAHKRIQRLKGSGVIERFTVKLDNERAGQGFVAFMLVKTRSDIKSSVFRDPHVREAFGVTGGHDLLLKLKFRDVSGFNDFVISFRKDPGVRETLSLVATSVLKEEI